MTAPIYHPDLQETKARFAEHRRRLRSAIEEWHHLATVEHPRLAALYEHHFGTLERERQQLALQCAELFRRVELLTVKATRGEVITPEVVDVVNAVVDKEYARLHQRYREAFEMTDRERQQAAAQRAESTSDGELTTMYRTLVKKLHPDAAEATEETQQAWHRVQQAYADRDVARLRTLLTVMGADDRTDEETASWSLERWQREEREIAARVRMEQRKLDRMKAEEPFVFAHELESPQWLVRHRAELEADLQRRRAEYVECRHRYAHLTGGGMPPATTAADKEKAAFEQDFMENTYFGGR